MNATILEVRPELAEFAKRMEHVLRANDHKGGWRRMSLDTLFNRATEEFDELLREIKWSRDPQMIAKEAVDVANFMLMIADNASRLLQYRKPTTTTTEVTP